MIKKATLGTVVEIGETEIRSVVGRPEEKPLKVTKGIAEFHGSCRDA